MIINTITDSSYFYQWLQSSSSYKNNFSYDGARLLQEYLDNLSDELNEPIEFDPIAWCCEFSEYENLEDYNNQHGTEFNSVDELAEYTSVINDGVLIVQDY